MKFLTIITIALLSTAAFAQDAAPAPAEPLKTETGTGNVAPVTAPVATPAPAPDKAYFEFDQADLATLAQAINELPKKQADPFLLKLQGQMQRQHQFKAQFEAATKEDPTPPKPRPNRK